MSEQQEPISVRGALACGAATLVAYVGVVHEVVGSTLYPQGPSVLGGPLGWHALGVSGIAAGLLLAAGVLGVAPVPIRTLAAAVAVCGAVIFVAAALVFGGFHFFALTLFVAALVLALTQRAPVPRRQRSTHWRSGLADPPRQGGHAGR
jgi:hypothetical protein